MAERTLPILPNITGPVYVRPDGKRTRNANGYDLADLVCQPCVDTNCAACETEPHSYTGWSTCDCNVGFKQPRRRG